MKKRMATWTSVTVGVLVLAACGSSGSSDTTAIPTPTITTTVTVTPTISSTATPAAQVTLQGTTRIGNAPLASANVSVWSADDAQPIATGKADASGNFSITAEAEPTDSLYLKASGGQRQGGREIWGPAQLATLLGTARPASVVIDERTTVAAAYAAAPWVSSDGTVVASPDQLNSAALTAASLVDPATGQLGPRGQQVAPTLNTLAGAVTACAGREPMCEALTTPSGFETTTTTFAGLAATARQPERGAQSIFAVQQGYRDFTPTLTEAPNEFRLL